MERGDRGRKDEHLRQENRETGQRDRGVKYNNGRKEKHCRKNTLGNAINTYNSSKPTIPFSNRHATQTQDETHFIKA